MPNIPAAYRSLIGLASGVLVVCSLYFGRAILAPMALALMLTFLLGPVVDVLQRRGLHSSVAAVLVCVLALGACAGVGLLLVVQMQSVVEGLPRYEDNIRQKLAVLRDAKSGPFSDEAQRTLQDLAGELNRDEEPATPVTVVTDGSTVMDRLGGVVGPLAGGGLVAMLVFFMLLQRRQLRDRIIYLFGRRNLTVTTKALDEAAQSISRYLLAQAFVQALFGLGVFVGLFLIGVPYALLWGVLAALLRFVPYLGPWIAASMPLTLSVATTTGWRQPLAVLGLYLVLEAVTNLALEPLFYSRAARLSPVALIVAVAVWTLLWGPVGLFLATPLTVCLYVLGRHVPQLAPLAFLIGNEPVAARDVVYYQRLLARDEDEAQQIATDFSRDNPAGRTYDELLLPALSSLRLDREDLTADEVRFGIDATRRVVESIEVPASNGVAHESAPLVLGCPATDEVDAVALQMLQRLVQAGHGDLAVLGPDLLVAEVLDEIARRQPAVVVIGSLAPGGLSRALLLCKRLAGASPRPHLVVGRWGSVAFERDEAVLREAGADRVAGSLETTLHEIEGLSRLSAPT